MICSNQIAIVWCYIIIQDQYHATGGVYLYDYSFIQKGKKL